MALKFKKIFYGAYEISRRGIIRRVEPAMGTYTGRRLKPYYSNPHYDEKYVSLQFEGYREQWRVSDLIDIAWK